MRRTNDERLISVLCDSPMRNVCGLNLQSFRMGSCRRMPCRALGQNIMTELAGSGKSGSQWVERPSELLRNASEHPPGLLCSCQTAVQCPASDPLPRLSIPLVPRPHITTSPAEERIYPLSFHPSSEHPLHDAYCSSSGEAWRPPTAPNRTRGRRTPCSRSSWSPSSSSRSSTSHCSSLECRPSL